MKNLNNYKNLENKWIALDKESNEIIEVAETLEELEKKLKEKIKNFYIFKLPRLDVNYVT